MAAPRYGRIEFIIDKRESKARGKNFWESPEWTCP